MTTNANATLDTGFNKDKYLELFQQFPPRPILSDTDLAATQDVIDGLLDEGNLSLEKSDYLNVLGSLIFEYEQRLDIFEVYQAIETILSHDTTDTIEEIKNV